MAKVALQSNLFRLHTQESFLSNNYYFLLHEVYNTVKIQPTDQVFCGHLCLNVLLIMSRGVRLQEIINDLY